MPGRNVNRRLLVIGAVLALAGWWAIDRMGGDDAGKAKPGVQVVTAPVQARDMPVELREVGTVVANETVGVRARLDSQLMEVKFKDGDYVHKDDLLFVLDDRTLKAQLAQQQANIKRDSAQRENLRQQYERNRQLVSKGFVSREELENAKAAYEAQSASVGAAEAAMESVNVQLGYTQITAPISGRTGTINITVGNNVKANDTQPLVVINQVKPIRVQVSLPQRYFDMVRKAINDGSVQVEAMRDDNKTASLGTLEYIDNQVDSSTGTFAARALFANDDEALWPGMFVTLRLQLGTEKGVLTIPEVAVQQSQDGNFVFVIADGKAVKRMVTVARVQDGVALIETGLTAGEQVAIDGMMTLGDGMDVTVQEKPPEQPATEAQPETPPPEKP